MIGDLAITLLPWILNGLLSRGYLRAEQIIRGQSRQMGDSQTASIPQISTFKHSRGPDGAGSWHRAVHASHVLSSVLGMSN